MDSPDQSASGIAVSTATFEDSVLKFEVANVGISFEGKLYRGNTIPGTKRPFL